MIYILFAASGILGLSFLFLFIKSVKQGQFDDTWSPARRMLIDDDKVMVSPPEGPACRAPHDRIEILDQGTRQAGPSAEENPFRS